MASAVAQKCATQAADNVRKVSIAYGWSRFKAAEKDNAPHWFLTRECRNAKKVFFESKRMLRKGKRGGFSWTPIPPIFTYNRDVLIGPKNGDVIYGLRPVLNALKGPDESLNICCSQIYISKTMFLNRYSRKNCSISAEETGDYWNELRDLLRISKSRRHISWGLCSDDLLDLLSNNRPHQGICLERMPPDYRAWVSFKRAHGSNNAQFKISSKSLWAFVEKCEDEVMLGCMIKSAQLSGVEHIFVNPEKVPKITPLVSEYSSGMCETMFLCAVDEKDSFMEDIERYGFEIETDTLGYQTSFREWKQRMDKPTLLLLKPME